jgi:hypothetical protein
MFTLGSINDEPIKRSQIQGLSYGEVARGAFTVDRLPTVKYNAKVAEDHYFRTFRNHALALTGMVTPVDQQYAQFKMIRLHRSYTMFLPRYFVMGQCVSWGPSSAFGMVWPGGQPTKYKKKSGRQTVWLTSELFKSQECSNCSHTHPDNRQTQALFVCKN